MRNLIITFLILFLLYTNASFRTYTIKSLQSITNFIMELPKEFPEESIKDEEDETLKSGSSTY